jgi:hypothetical protein
MAATALLLVPHDAHAQSPPDAPALTPAPALTSAPAPALMPAPASPEDDRLSRFLELAASQGHRCRMRAAGWNATSAVLTLPLSIVLLTRPDPGVQAVGAALIPSAAVDLVDLWSSLSFRLPMEVLRDHYEARRAAGQSPSVARAETEAEWRDAAAQPGRSAPPCFS